MQKLTTIIALAVIAAWVSAPGALAQQGDDGMSREAIYADIQATLGLVPTFMKSIPDSSLELQWRLMKRVQMEPGAIPNKYRELIGLAVSAATKCEYCVYFHAEMARLSGAGDEEIQDALLYTKSTTGWSTYINGSQPDMETFKAEIKAIADYLRAQEVNKTSNRK